MALELRRVKVHLTKVPSRVPPGLIVKMFRSRVPAFATCCHCFCSYCLAELDHGDKTVAARAIPFFRSLKWPRSKGGERTPVSRGKTNWDAWSLIGERVNDIVS